MYYRLMYIDMIYVVYSLYIASYSVAVTVYLVGHPLPELCSYSLCTHSCDVWVLTCAIN